MNRILFNPFGIGELPDKVDDYLETGGGGTCMSFNQAGNLLAVGTLAGQVAVFDFDAKLVACVLGNPSKDMDASVTCISFPAPGTGVTVLAGHRDGRVVMYDVLAKRAIVSATLPGPIVQVEGHPNRPEICTAVTPGSFPHVLQLRNGLYIAPPDVDQPTELLEERGPLTPTGDVAKAEELRRQWPNLKPPPEILTAAPKLVVKPLATPSEIVAAQDPMAEPPKTAFVVRFTPNGDRVLRGGTSGVIRTFELTDDCTPRCTAAAALPAQAAIRDIVFSRAADKVLVISTDRQLRLFRTALIVGQPSGSGSDFRGDPRAVEPLTTFSDVVNKKQCRTAVFSPDGEFVVGGMYGTEHTLQVWRTSDGHLDRTLSGPREAVGQLAWRPWREVFVSLGRNTGLVYVWERNVSENWSAFAPDFCELEQNDEYSEREDEFDVRNRPDVAARRAKDALEESQAVVDVISTDPAADHPDGPPFFVPVDSNEPVPAAAPPRRAAPDGARPNGARKRARAPGNDRRPRGRPRTGDGPNGEARENASMLAL